jgi:hypothetical protein
MIYINNVDRAINSVLVDGNIVSSKKEIFNVFESHYRYVFQKDVYDPEMPDVSDMPYVPGVKIDSSLTPFTEGELLFSTKKLGRNKAPGPDGITNELLIGFVLERPKWFLNLFNGWLSGMSIPAVVKRCFIALILKVEMPNMVRDWRPISLLNGVFKLYTSLVKDRLGRLVEGSLHPSQSGFISGRWIHENLVMFRLVWDKFYGETSALDADVENAFPSLSQSYLLNLIKLWLGDAWSTIIENILGSDIQLIINGELSNSIFNKRGVLQGDSLAPLLFIVAINGFLVKLHKKDYMEWNGINLSSSSFADDLMKYVWNAGSVRRTVKLFDKFRSTGLRLNLRKTKILGNFSFLDNQGLEVVSRQRFLGLIWDADLHCFCEASLFQKIKERMLLLRGIKRFTIQGIVNCINSYAFPLILYISRAQRLSDCFIQQYKSLCYTLINRSDKSSISIKWDRLTGDSAYGGYGLLDPIDYNKAALLSWIPYLFNWLSGVNYKCQIAHILFNLVRSIRIKFNSKVPLFMGANSYETNYSFLNDLNWAAKNSFFYWKFDVGEEMFLWNLDDTVQFDGLCTEVDGPICKVDFDNVGRDSCMFLPSSGEEDVEKFLISRIASIKTRIIVDGGTIGRFSQKLSDIVVKNYDVPWTSAQLKWKREVGFDFVEFLNLMSKAKIYNKAFNLMKDILHVKLRTLYKKDSCFLCNGIIGSSHFLWDCSWLIEEWSADGDDVLSPNLFKRKSLITRLCAFSTGAWYFHCAKRFGKEDFDFREYVGRVVHYNQSTDSSTLKKFYDLKL